MQSARPFIDADTLRASTFVRNVEIHDTLGSTNDRAAELARQLPTDELPALVVARRQTAGRGRGKHIWWSADGALMFSLLVEPATFGIAVPNWPQLSLATAVAVCDALVGELTPPSTGEHREASIGIKWPNDVLVGGRKVCGILIESPGGAAAVSKRLVIGIGINVNNSLRDAPADIGATATALCDATEREHEMQSLLGSVLSAFALRMSQLQRDDPELAHEWQRRNVLAGRTVAVEENNRRIEGKCVDIATDGALLVEALSGRQRLVSGSVRVIG